MRFTLGWLKEFLETDADLVKITDTLTALGLEVEEIKDYGNKLNDFIVVEIIDTKPHPEAEKLQICQVNNGRELLQIVCGAKNARNGLKTVLAPIGSIIPSNSLKIKEVKIKNIASYGMMCSFGELGLTSNDDGIIELDNNALIGDNFCKYCGIDDPEITINITPNRGDCLGVYGIARDLAAAGLGKLKDLVIPQIPCSFQCPIQATQDHGQLFIGYYLKNVTNNQSPQWLVNRLKSIDKSSISLLVDITNYINFSFARPLHAYDADKISGNIKVTRAKNEKLTALNDVTYQLDEQDIIIADNEKPLALAGIIGAKDSGCSMNTTNIFLESALFDIELLTNSARKHKIDTDARYRFERNVDANFTHHGLKLAVKLILELAGGEVSFPVIVGNEKLPNKTLLFHWDKVAKIGGVDISKQHIIEILLSLGFVVKDHHEQLLLEIPSWRNDIALEVDIVEEILRIYGYDQIGLTMLPRNSMLYSNAMSNEIKRINIFKRKLANLGMTEIISWSFMSLEKAKYFGSYNPELLLQNPMSLELNYMRNSILPNLIDIAKKNSNRAINNLAIFEVGNVFHGLDQSHQYQMLTAIRTGKNLTRNHYKLERDYDFFDAKADVAAILAETGISFDQLALKDNVPSYYHPKKSSSIYLGKTIIGYIGDLHPQLLTKMQFNSNVIAFEIFLDNLPVNKSKNSKIAVYQVSDYQIVSRDFAFILDKDFAAQQLLKIIKAVNKQLIKEVNIFDLYVGDKIDHEQKSLAVNVLLQADNRTLIEKEIEEICNNIINAVLKNAGGKLRAS